MTVAAAPIAPTSAPSSAAEQLEHELDRVAALITMYESEGDLSPDSGELVTLESLRIHHKHVESQLADARRVYGYLAPQDHVVIVDKRLVQVVAVGVAGFALATLTAWLLER